MNRDEDRRGRDILVVALFFLVLSCCGCETLSLRATAVDSNSWKPEQMTAYRDEARVPYDRGGSELSEGHVVDTNDTDQGTIPAIGDWITGLIGILPLDIRIQVLKVEIDVYDQDDVEAVEPE